MFPPAKVDNPYELVSGVLGSLARGGGSFRQDVLVDAVDQDFLVTVGLIDHMPSSAEKPMKKYIRGYAKESGWTAKKFHLFKGYFTFELSKPDEASRRNAGRRRRHH